MRPWPVTVALRTAGMLCAVSILAFLVLHAMPGDPVAITLIADNVPVTPATVAALKHRWGLDRPLVAQYADWLGRFTAGDWGRSFRTARPIRAELLGRLPTSLTLGLGGLALALGGGVVLGFLAARRPRGAADVASRMLSIGAQAIPAFWLGLLLIWLLAAEFRLLRPFTGGQLERLVLPTLVVALYHTGSFARVVRYALLQAEAAPFFLTAQAKGLSHSAALFRHGARLALLAVLAAMPAELAWAIGGTAVVEVVFAVDGISRFLVESIAVRDYFVLQAYIMVIAIWMLGIHLLTSLLRHRLDPRVP